MPLELEPEPEPEPYPPALSSRTDEPETPPPANRGQPSSLSAFSGAATTHRSSTKAAFTSISAIELSEVGAATEPAAERSGSSGKKVSIISPEDVPKSRETDYFDDDPDDPGEPCGEEVVVTVTSLQRFKYDGTTAMKKIVEAIHEEQQWADGLAQRAGGMRLLGRGGSETPRTPLLGAQSGRGHEWLGDAAELAPRPVHVGVSMGGHRVELPLQSDDLELLASQADSLTTAQLLQLLNTIKTRQEQRWRGLQARARAPPAPRASRLAPRARRPPPAAQPPLSHPSVPPTPRHDRLAVGSGSTQTIARTTRAGATT